MIKTLLIASAICMALATNANAASRCDLEQRAALEKQIQALPEGEQKTAALKEWDLSTKAFTDNNMNECDSKMNEASKAGGLPTQE